MTTILETNILHASDVIHWLDGSSHSIPAKMAKIGHTLNLELSIAPQDLTVVHSVGKTGLLRKQNLPIVVGEATEAQRMYPIQQDYTLAGIVCDDKNRFNPRLFSITAGNVSTQNIVLYPTPVGTKISSVGTLRASLRWATTELPVAWAMATLSITVPTLPDPQIYIGQADHRGELVIPWHRLPPLSTGQNNYAATLTVNALSSAHGKTPIDPSTLIAAELESTTNAASFSASLALTVVPGEILVVRSDTKDHLTVQPS